ncbi:hypothetical protein CS544_02600 [Porphyromonas gingivalis]|nr:hypothetical protein CS544_02600 [Porphyromonas gingivalis]OWR80755.1 hypothetical protein SJDPG11_03205 [Porphyromonas gingivalis SJD11]
MIKSEFIHRTVSSGFQRISKMQERAAARSYGGGTGHLRSYFASVPVDVSEPGGLYRLRTLDYTRFLDIKYAKGGAFRSSGRAPLYNRVVWGVLYRNVIPTLKYEFTSQVREQIREDLSSINNES